MDHRHARGRLRAAVGALLLGLFVLGSAAQVRAATPVATEREYCFKLDGTASEGSKVWLRWRNSWYSYTTSLGEDALAAMTSLRNQLIAQAGASGDVVGPLSVDPVTGEVSFCIRGPTTGLGTIRFINYEDGFRSGYKRPNGPKDAKAEGYGGAYLGAVTSGQIRVRIKGLLDGIEKVLDLLMPAVDLQGGNLNEKIVEQLEAAGVEARARDVEDETGAPLAGFFVPGRCGAFDSIDEFDLEYDDPGVTASLASITEAVAHINEVDADQTLTDSVEFLELAGVPDEDLSGHWLVFYNGNGDAEYFVIDLAGQTVPADGYFVVGVPGVANVDLVPPGIPATNAIQNGADAIALWFDPSGLLTLPDFQGTTADTPPAGVQLVDALVYGTADADDLELLAALTPGDPQADENDQFNKDIESLQRRPEFGAPFDSASYMVGAPSPGTRNTWSDEGSALPGVAGFPDLLATGDLSGGSLNTFGLASAAPLSLVGIFLGLVDNPTPFKGGLLVPVPYTLLLFAPSDTNGELVLPFAWPVGVPPDVEIWVQMGIQDAAAVVGVSLSNAVLGITS